VFPIARVAASNSLDERPAPIKPETDTTATSIADRPASSEYFSRCPIEFLKLGEGSDIIFPMHQHLTESRRITRAGAEIDWGRKAVYCNSHQPDVLSRISVAEGHSKKYPRQDADFKTKLAREDCP
ncbi:MAG TPA: hypothetical protein VGP28_07420, partial [Methylocella sp.]|nr:hypothetical protein [Methylocella sp.]